jgi:hypothetical protein
MDGDSTDKRNMYFNLGLSNTIFMGVDWMHF